MTFKYFILIHYVSNTFMVIFHNFWSFKNIFLNMNFFNLKNENNSHFLKKYQHTCSNSTTCFTSRSTKLHTFEAKVRKMMFVGKASTVFSSLSDVPHGFRDHYHIHRLILYTGTGFVSRVRYHSSPAAANLGKIFKGAKLSPPEQYKSIVPRTYQNMLVCCTESPVTHRRFLITLFEIPVTDKCTIPNLLCKPEYGFPLLKFKAWITL